MPKWSNVDHDKIMCLTLDEFWDDNDAYWYTHYAGLEILYGCCSRSNTDYLRYAFETFGAIRYASSSGEHNYEKIAEANMLKVLVPCGLQSVLQLSGFHSLTALYLSECHITDELVVAFTSLTFAHLHNLKLSRNDITCIGARALSDMLMDNSSLKSLELQHNLIKDDGGAALARLITHNNTPLQSLDLCHNRFSSNVALVFKAALKSNFHLVEFTACPVFRCELSNRPKLKLSLGIFLLCCQRQTLALYSAIWEEVLQTLFYYNWYGW
jgi:hypothetical protein